MIAGYRASAGALGYTEADGRRAGETALEARIIGLKGCGKTHPGGRSGRGTGRRPHRHRARGRRPRARLSEIFQPKKTTFAEFKVREVAWPEASARKGEMERYLDALAGGQVYLHVLRAFDSPLLGEPAHPEADLEELDREFLLFDLIRIERAFERAKKAPLPDAGKKALARCQEALEAETPLREVDFDEAAADLHPRVPVPDPDPAVAGASTPSRREQPGRRAASGGGRPGDGTCWPSPSPMRSRCPALRGGAGGIRGRSGPARPGGRRGGPGGLRATGAHQLPHHGQRRGAGLAHPRAARRPARRPAPSTPTSSGASSGPKWSPTTTSCSHGNMKACRDAGVLRVEGKDYIVADGDIINFRFNV